MTEIQPLPPNLNEKMEYVLLNFIEELHVTGIPIQESYESLSHDATDDVIDDAIEDAIDNLCDISYAKLFNEISNNYFNEEDKNELEKNYRDDPNWKSWTRMSISYKEYIHTYMIAINFARQNKNFIKNILYSLNTSNPLLK